jgi:hypothetical protein
VQEPPEEIQYVHTCQSCCWDAAPQSRLGSLSPGGDQGNEGSRGWPRNHTIVLEPCQTSSRRALRSEHRAKVTETRAAQALAMAMAKTIAAELGAVPAKMSQST